MQVRIRRPDARRGTLPSRERTRPFVGRRRGREPGFRRKKAKGWYAVSAAKTDHDQSRRDFLYLATGTAAAVGAAVTAWPFVSQMNPNAATRALASIEVDVSSIEPGQAITVKWRGKPVFIRNRTDEEVSAAK
ncbi:MAG: ubiquinol-cytochrome c reductase iron-sulfur subunit, partial [Nitratireductor sp.]|nr:ubiquinol-cytochrome c reductase iron-sulfur subunit [Nitratireductor sp.]